MATLSKYITYHIGKCFDTIIRLGSISVVQPLHDMVTEKPLRFIILGVGGCLLLYTRLPGRSLPAGNKSVLVTGCDSGFGHALVKKLDSCGIKVYAGCLDKNGFGATELVKSCSDKVTIVQLDITNGQQIEEALDYVSKDIGEEGLWGLVNNAGVWFLAEIELTPEKVFRRAMEVNTFGTMRMTKAFLPLIRKAQGRIVNMSSVTGCVPFIGFAAYCMSKSSIESYSDILRMEMKKWGVNVSLIEPSGYSTPALTLQTITQKRDGTWNSLDSITKSTYGKDYFNKMYDNFESSIPSYPSDVSPVVQVLYDALLKETPKARYPVGPGASLLTKLYRFLPTWLSDKMVARLGFTVRDVKPLMMIMDNK